MGKEHLTYFKVENFKRFDSLELTDIGQFNLIVGDNNVGKTSVLEALLFDFNRRKCLLNLHKTLFLKGLNIRPKMVYGPKGDVVEVSYPEENFLRYVFKSLNEMLKMKVLFKDTAGESSISLGSVGYSDEYEAEFAEEVFVGKSPDNRYVAFTHTWPPGTPKVVHDDETGTHVIEDEGWYTEIAGLYEHLLQSVYADFSFITTSLPSSNSLPKSYFEQVDLSRKEKKQLIEDMKFLLPEVEDFEVRKIGGEDQLLVGMKGIDELMPISTFGESVIRATQILLEISKHKGKRLMIDEIDTGIHYSRMKNFLKTIFQVAEKNDVQLFMTTHSLECQQAFAEVFEEPDMVQFQSKMKQFSLIEKPDGQVVANPHNFEQLQYALEIGFETRGGRPR